jgi:ribosomal protein S18 acetylase RimI-like enzyme
MPEIEIRPAVVADIPRLVGLDHNYSTNSVWQMEFSQTEERGVAVKFREVRLPRQVRVEYPRRPLHLLDDWEKYDGLLVAQYQDAPVGYVGLKLGITPLAGWITDLVVTKAQRRQGVGSVLLLAAQEWAAAHDCHNLILEMQPKNQAAIRLAYHLGFGFCGYNDNYYSNHDIALFFARLLR